MSRRNRSEAVIPFLKGPAILDVGCAGQKDLASVVDSGAWVHGVIRETFPDVTGIDLNSGNIDRLVAMGYGNVFCQSAEDIDLETKFDTIFAGELVEHLSNPGKFLDAARNHLNDGGRVVITTPNPFSLYYNLRSIARFPRSSPNPQHTCWFCPGTFSILSERHGFQVSEFRCLEDYDYSARSPAYYVAVRVLAFFRKLLPERLGGNTLLFVLERPT